MYTFHYIYIINKLFIEYTYLNKISSNMFRFDGLIYTSLFHSNGTCKCMYPLLRTCD